MQSDNTDNMMFPIAETIAYVTQGITLEPGDIVFTGTPSGVGHARKPNPVWMKQGDTCEIDIEGVGVLVNPIENEKVETHGELEHCSSSAARCAKAPSTPWCSGRCRRLRPTA